MSDGIVGGDLGEVAIEGAHGGLHRADAARHELGRKPEALGVVVSHAAAGAVAGLAVRAGRALVALRLGLAARQLGHLEKRGVELLKTRRADVQGCLHARHRELGRARAFGAAFQHFPIEAETEAHGNQAQEQVARDVGEARAEADGREHLVEQPDDHRHQHGDGKADDQLMDERQVAHVGLDQLQHADIGRDPGQGAEADDQNELS